MWVRWQQEDKCLLPPVSFKIKEHKNREKPASELETREDVSLPAQNFEEFLPDIVKMEQNHRSPSKLSMEKQHVLAINVGSTSRKHKMVRAAELLQDRPGPTSKGLPQSLGQVLSDPTPHPGHHA